MKEREKIKKRPEEDPTSDSKKKTAATYEGGKTNKQKETLQIAMAANDAAIRKPDEREKKWREKRGKQMVRLDFYEARQHEPITKKTGDGLRPFPLHTRRHDGKRKKMAGTVGCQRRRQNTNTKVSDGSTK